MQSLENGIRMFSKKTREKMEKVGVKKKTYACIIINNYLLTKKLPQYVGCWGNEKARTGSTRLKV